MDMDIIKRFICGAKEAHKKVDNHSFNFPITIESAYRLATNIEKLLKEQPEIVRCKDCKYYDYFNGCMSWHDVNSNNDNWYCADGERKEGR